MNIDPEMILIYAGIDPEKMEYLTRDERIKILLSAGLDPSEYDF